MRTQTYTNTELGMDSNVKNTSVDFQINCCGEVYLPYKYGTINNIRNDVYYLYLLSGTLHMNDETVLPGDIIIMEPEHYFNWKSEGAINYLWVHYTGYEALSFTKSVIGSLNKKKHIGIRSDICAIFEKMFHEFIISDKPSYDIRNCLLIEILSLTSRYMNTSDENLPPLAAIEYIHKHFKEEITINHLCDLEHLSPTAFRIIFKKHTGLSPNEYIILQRVNAACSLLEQTNMSVKDVAAEVGYTDPYYFSRIFSKKIGMSPFKYRSKSREDAL